MISTINKELQTIIENIHTENELFTKHDYIVVKMIGEKNNIVEEIATSLPRAIRHREFLKNDTKSDIFIILKDIDTKSDDDNDDRNYLICMDHNDNSYLVDVIEEISGISNAFKRIETLNNNYFIANVLITDDEILSELNRYMKVSQ